MAANSSQRLEVPRAGLQGTVARSLAAGMAAMEQSFTAKLGTVSVVGSLAGSSPHASLATVACLGSWAGLQRGLSVLQL